MTYSTTENVSPISSCDSGGIGLYSQQGEGLSSNDTTIMEGLYASSLLELAELRTDNDNVSSRISKKKCNFEYESSLNKRMLSLEGYFDEIAGAQLEKRHIKRGMIMHNEIRQDKGVLSSYKKDDDIESHHVSFNNVCLMDRLESFKSLEEDWDGYGALPMAEGAYKNMKRLIEVVSPKILSRWRLFPGKNGSLSLETKDEKVAGISIGNTTMSYGLVTDNGKVESWQGKFSAETAQNVLAKVNRLLGY